MKKSELKAIIKQCIVEVLTEGLGDDVATTIAEHKRTRVAAPLLEGPRGPRKSLLDPNIVAAMAPDRIRVAAGGNPVMESILADTARNTLPGMSTDGLLGSTDGDALGGHQQDAQDDPNLPQEARLMAGLNPEDLFGEETMARMAKLAMPKRLP